jgi:3-mercaptopyruvate sulfurtransferase SseA
VRGLKGVILAIASVGLAIGYLSLTHSNPTPKEITWEDVLTDARKWGYQVITTEQLSKLHKEKDILLVDTRQDWEYRRGHIKGAVNFPIEPTWWSRWRKSGALEAALGPDKERSIVFY